MFNRHSGLRRLRSILAFSFRRSSVGISLLALLVIVCSCATTRFTANSPCLQTIDSESRVLVPWLPEKNTDFYLKGLKQIFEKGDVGVASLAEEEWNLRVSGIRDPLDSSTFSKLQKAGFTHLLLVKELSNRSESSLVYYTALELSWENVTNAYKPSWNEQGNQSEILLQLVSLDDLHAVHSVIARTTITHLTVRHRDQGETYLNPTTVEAARYRAMMKGARRMLEECP